MNRLNVWHCDSCELLFTFDLTHESWPSIQPIRMTVLAMVFMNVHFVYKQHCPPCRQMLPQLRKAAIQRPDIHFGTVDCTVHNPLCNQNNVRSYPTTIMYNNSKPHMNAGYKTAEEIVDFIEVGKLWVLSLPLPSSSPAVWPQGWGILVIMTCEIILLPLTLSDLIEKSDTYTHFTMNVHGMKSTRLSRALWSFFARTCPKSYDRATLF